MGLQSLCAVKALQTFVCVRHVGQWQAERGGRIIMYTTAAIAICTAGFRKLVPQAALHVVHMLAVKLEHQHYEG